MDSQALEVLKDGAFSVRRTEKSCAMSAIDLTLEQTVNRDAASPATRISAFRNSDKTFKRWSITLTQRGMVLSELYKQVDIQSNETSSNQLKNSRITRDICYVKLLTDTLKSTCHPFAANTPVIL